MKLYLNHQKIRVFLAASYAALIFSSQGLAAEKLANPFGGQPPDYSPGEENHTDWTFKLEGWKRNFTIGTSDPMGKTQKRSSYTIHSGATSPNGKIYCAAEPAVKVTKKGFSILRSEIGCWEKIGNSKYKDLGGYRHGSYKCTFTSSSAKAAKCTYTSAKDGKKYKLTMKSEVLGW